MSEAIFHKPVYGREKRRSSKPLEEFDPRPPECKNTAQERLTEFLGHGKGLCVSLMFNSGSQYWHDETQGGSGELVPPKLPCKEELQTAVEEFKKSLHVSALKLRQIEQNTRDQSQSALWFSVRRYRITASYFGAVRRRLPTTPPQSLVLQILEGKQFLTPATEWGKKHEQLALKQYEEYQHRSGHEGLYTCRSGFVISEDYPYLGVSPDAVVYDPTSTEQFGLAEVKCPYSYRLDTLSQACTNKDFCSTLVTDDGKEHLKLQRNHPYFSQVQGQMAITGRSWCDFVILTKKDLSVERITFDQEFWQIELLPKLTEFFDNCLAPEIVSPVHVLGMPVRDLSKM
jgi:hypothetical protein